MFICLRVGSNRITSIDLRLLAGNHSLTSGLNYGLRTVNVNCRLSGITSCIFPCNISHLILTSSGHLGCCAALPRADVVIGLFGRRRPRVTLVNTASINHSLKPHISSSLFDKLATSYAVLRVNRCRSGGTNGRCSGLLCRVHPTFNNGVMTAVIGPRYHPRVTAIHRNIVGGRVCSTSRHNRVAGLSISGCISSASFIIRMVRHRVRGSGLGVGNTPVIITNNCKVNDTRNFGVLCRLTSILNNRINT